MKIDLAFEREDTGFGRGNIGHASRGNSKGHPPQTSVLVASPNCVSGTDTQAALRDMALHPFLASRGHAICLGGRTKMR